MKGIIVSEKNKFQILPYDVKALIFDYLALLDLSNLSMVCKDFNSVLQNHSSIWARHLFRSFLRKRRKTSPFSDEDIFPNFLTVDQRDVNFEEMREAKKLIIDHYYIRKRWKTFVQSFYNPIDAQNFVKEIFTVLEKPSLPSPCVKKDVHYFLTNSIFQNFLTEIHFDIQGKAFFQERKQTIAAEIAQEIDISFFQKHHDCGEIHNMRWYLNQHSLKASSPNSFHSLSSKSVISFQSKKISKSFLVKQRRHILGKKNKKGFPQGKKHPFHVKGNTQSRSYLQGFFVNLQDLIENYCEMVFAYLRVLQDSNLLLSEYTRLWNKFVLLTIDFNSSFAPFANLLNQFYDETYDELPNFPEFSVWRFMAKIWINRVFSNLSYYLKECFRAALLEIRLQESKQAADAGQGHSFLKIYQSGKLPETLFERFFYRFQRNEDSKYKLSKERVMSLLKDFYQSLADLSFNEYTIFYWDCAQSGDHSPTTILEGWLIQDTRVYYEYCLDYFLNDSVYFLEFLSKDCSLIESITGKTFGREIKKLKVWLFRTFLVYAYKQALDEVKQDVEREIQFKDEAYQIQNGFMGMRDLSFGDIAKILELQEHHSNPEENRKRIIQKLNRNCPTFSNYLYFIKAEQENIENQNKEFEEIKGHRLLRGFMVPDPKFDCLFNLREPCSINCIFGIGKEGRKIKEKLEDLDERILFL